jgi:hypothetical protein
MNITSASKLPWVLTADAHSNMRSKAEGSTDSNFLAGSRGLGAAETQPSIASTVRSSTLPKCSGSRRLRPWELPKLIRACGALRFEPWTAGRQIALGTAIFSALVKGWLGRLTPSAMTGRRCRRLDTRQAPQRSEEDHRGRASAAPVALHQHAEVMERLCRFPKFMSFSRLKCHLNVINDKKVGKIRSVDLRAMQAVEDPRVDGRRQDS